MKKFTINCDFGGQMAPFTIFIGEPESEHHPLHFQADWLSKERNGTIPSQVMDAIAKLKDLAIKNHVSLEELCVYALGAVGADESQDDEAEESENISGQEAVVPDISDQQVQSTENAEIQNSVEMASDQVLSTQEAAETFETQSNQIVDDQVSAMDNVSVDEGSSSVVSNTQTIDTSETQVNQQSQEAGANITVQEEGVNDQAVGEVVVQENSNSISEEQVVVADNNVLSEQQSSDSEKK